MTGTSASPSSLRPSYPSFWKRDPVALPGTSPQRGSGQPASECAPSTATGPGLALRPAPRARLLAPVTRTRRHATARGASPWRPRPLSLFPRPTHLTLRVLRARPPSACPASLRPARHQKQRPGSQLGTLGRLGTVSQVPPRPANRGSRGLQMPSTSLNPPPGHGQRERSSSGSPSV